MKKTIGILLVVLCLLSLTPSAFAEHMEGKSGWSVTYTAGGKMESNFRTSDYNDPVAGLQPGDDITFTVTLNSQNSDQADWYMTNEVLHSLEDRSTGSGGAYTYTLTYNGPSGSKVIYSSDTVGGEDVSSEGTGLHEATSALKNYFYLDTLSKGQSATITLNVALDGESQGNRYQDTMADLQMNFAVESRGAVRTVQTGDPVRLVTLYALMMLSGCGFLALAIADIRTGKKRSAS